VIDPAISFYRADSKRSSSHAERGETSFPLRARSNATTLPNPLGAPGMTVLFDNVSFATERRSSPATARSVRS
jgi:hypothetical protein